MRSYGLIDNVHPDTVTIAVRPLKHERSSKLSDRRRLFGHGHDAGAENWAIIASLIETCKLNAVDPMAYLTATLNAIVSGHKQNRIEGLIPWNFKISAKSAS